MRHCLLAVLGLFFSFCANAQKYPINLANEKFGNKLYDIEVARVIDLRHDTTNIGWIGKGMGNMKMHGNLPGNFTNELFEFLNNNLVSGKNPYRLIVKVNKFNLITSAKSAQE